MNINQTIKQQLINGQISLKKIIDWISFTEKNNTIDTVQNYLLRLIQDLNNEKLEHKVKIIYDLEQFYQKYSQYHWQVMVILTHFVQNHTGYVTGEIPTDIQAALTVIGRRDSSQDEEQLDLSYTDIRGANLAGANFPLTNLYQVNLSGANLTGANLSGVILSAANLCGANLAGANLCEAILCAANLAGANLTGANLQRANLYLATLQGASLNDATLDGANLREAKL
ncbi:pentapeptide repeat-containing protein [Chrysosporum bergii ANA360D]|uniref:Pentapeptide repeat-containing protein n=1 Tax=Chrysosporum bergii ANA360D TaxID=617107 RepID=A0AA43GTR8_9CYAN|nr:pentapeptide repeat-containing protein [Chrysosporum bergii]MDH6061420.1 pentapeptide repeat-containing protein [Chrysosporum bergii ANA360D]